MTLLKSSEAKLSHPCWEIDLIHYAWSVGIPSKTSGGHPSGLFQLRKSRRTLCTIRPLGISTACRLSEPTTATLYTKDQNVKYLPIPHVGHLVTARAHETGRSIWEAEKVVLETVGYIAYAATTEFGESYEI